MTPSSIVFADRPVRAAGHQPTADVIEGSVALNVTLGRRAGRARRADRALHRCPGHAVAARPPSIAACRSTTTPIPSTASRRSGRSGRRSSRASSTPSAGRNFNQAAVSPAQAYGLMQVTPDAGRYVANRAGVSFDRAADHEESAGLPRAVRRPDQASDRSRFAARLQRRVAPSHGFYGVRIPGGWIEVSSKASTLDIPAGRCWPPGGSGLESTS
ncbi:hypothetical protein ABIE49_000804 [Bradyrhizobium sp. OAE829]